MADYTIVPPEQVKKYTIVPPQPQAKPNTAVLGPVDMLLDPFKETGHQLAEGGREVAKAFAPEDVAGRTKIQSPMGDLGGRLRHLFSGLGQEGYGLAGGGVLNSVLGRPIEAATGGKVSREVPGDLASMAIPVADELNAAREAKALAKTMGVTEDAAKALIKRMKEGRTSEKEAKDSTFVNNVDALKRLGIDPSLIVSRPSDTVRRLGNLVGQNLMFGGPTQRAVQRTERGVEEATTRAVDKLADTGAKANARSGVQAGDRDFGREIFSGQTRDDAGARIKKKVADFAKSTPGAEAERARQPVTAVEAIEHAAKRTKSNVIGWSNKADILYEGIEKKIPPGTQIPMHNTRAALNDLQYRIPDSAWKSFNEHPQVTDMIKRLGEGNDRMTWAGARRLRTEIRSTLMGDPGLRGKISDREINNLYHAMTDDLQGGARAIGGDPLAAQVKRTDDYYKAGMNRIEKTFDDVYGSDKKSPAETFDAVLRDARAKGGNLPRLMRLRRSLPPDEWRDVAAAALDHAGEPLDYQRGGEHEYSFRTFLKNINKMGESASRGEKPDRARDTGLKILFDGAGHGGVYQDIKDIAHAASQLQEVDKRYIRGSGSAVSTTQSGAAFLATVLGGMATGHGAEGAALAATEFGAGLTAATVLGSPKIANYLADIARSRPAATTASEIPRLEAAVRKDRALMPLLIVAKGGRASQPPGPNEDDQQ